MNELSIITIPAPPQVNEPATILIIRPTNKDVTPFMVWCRGGEEDLTRNGIKHLFDWYGVDDGVQMLQQMHYTVVRFSPKEAQV